MARYKRDCPPGSVQHLVQRFVNREFRLDDQGRQELLRRIGAVSRTTDWRWLGYGLMSTHTHQISRAGRNHPSSWLKALNTGMAHYLNQAQGRLGPVFADRPKSIGCKEEHVARLLAYVHNNPVRAGIVCDPVESEWTSHRSYVGAAPVPPWLDVAWGLSASGFSSTSSGRDGFHQFVRDQAALPRDEALSGENFAMVRAAVRRELGPTVELGHADPADAIALAHPIWSRETAASYRRWGGDLYVLLTEVAVAEACPIEEICSRRRTARNVRARRLFVMAGALLQRPLAELGAVVGLSGQGVAGLLHSNPEATQALEVRAAELAARVAA